jgi:probable rRNA maturation factor
MAELDIQISIEDIGWPPEESLRAMAERVLETAARHLREEEKQPFPKMPP